MRDIVDTKCPLYILIIGINPRVDKIVIASAYPYTVVWGITDNIDLFDNGIGIVTELNGECAWSFSVIFLSGRFY
jgi:hypothetical protein